MLGWLFGKEKKQESGTAILAADIHSHLIPDIDDGVQTLEQSIEIIKILAAGGVKNIVTTPHIMQGGFDNTPEIIYAGLQTVKEEIAKQNIPVKMEAAAEYYFDDNFMALAKKGELLTFGDRNILFELPASSRPRQLEEIIFVLNSQGYKPILAHPERYTYMHSAKLTMYEDLKDFDISYQVNLLSFTGYYSDKIKDIAEALADAGMISWLGSDFHNLRHAGKMEEVLNNEYIFKLTSNPELMNNKLAL